LGTSIAAPRTRQLVLDPPTEIKAASSISARGCLRLSSIYLLVHDWSQSKVKPICAGAANPPRRGTIERALAWAGRGARRKHRARMIAPDLHLENGIDVRARKTRPGGNEAPRRGCKVLNRENFRRSPIESRAEGAYYVERRSNVALPTSPLGAQRPLCAQ
jgi:hypothetical protein